jgi:hypothetical protein
VKKSERISAAVAEAAKTQGSVVIEQRRVLEVALEVAGPSLIQNSFSQKAVEEMLRKHMGISVQREKKKPRELLESAKIRNVEGRICVPPQAFKAAMVTGGTSQMKSLKKKALQTQLFVVGDSIPITYEREIPRMDITRLSGPGRTPDVRFRPEFENWKARMIIQFADVLSVASVVDLLHRAGTVGVCEWRPERNGTHGRFHVVRNITDAKEIEEVRTECEVPLVSLRIPDWALDMDIDPAMLQRAFSEGTSSTIETEEDTEEKTGS